MSDSAIGESANPNYQQKQLDNGFKDAPCFVCGSVGLNGHQSLTESLYNILVKTRTVISSDKTNSICSTCSTSSELMEQAVQAQLSLAEKNRKRLGVTKNGSNITSLATHLLKAGSAVNMSGNVHQAQTDVDNENDEENLNLLISNIQGGLGQTDQGELKQTDLSQVDQPDIDNEFSIISEYNSPQQQVEIPRLECEIFEHEDLTRNSPSSNDNIRMGFLSHYQNDLGSESASDWKCPMCYLVFESSPDLIDHVRSVHSETRTGEYMTCPFCTKSFPTYAQFDDHVTKMHGDGSYSCQGCHSVFLRSTLLRRHQQLCKQYKNVLEQNRDTDTTKATAVSTCSLCLIKFSSALLLAEHVNSCHTDSLSKKYNCEGCKAGFDLLKGLYSHQNECMVYLGLKKTSIDSSYSVLFRCHGCPKVFNDYGNFQLHKQVCKAVKDMLNIEDRVDQEEESVSVEVSDSVLDLAQEDISSKLNHSSNTPAVASPPDIIGTGCQEKFLEVEQLTNHEVVYKDKVEPKMKEFVCEICVISFDYKCLLDFHKLVHKDPERKPYRCIGCNAGFVARTHKIDHESKCGKVRNMNNFVKHNKASSESDSIVPEAASCIEKHSATNKEGSVELELDQCSNPTNSAKSFWCKGCSKQFAFFCDFENHLAFCLKPVGANPDDQGDAMDCASESSACKDMSEGENCSESNESSVCNSMTGANSSGFIECPICGVEIASISDRKRSGKVQKHVAGHDEPARRYCCVGCRWSCDFRALFIAHSKQCKVLFKQYPLKNNSSAGVNCPACFIHFSDISQCKEHFFSCHYSASKVTNTEMLSCDGCQGSFNSLDDLENHQDNCLLFRRSGPAINAHKNRRCGICNVDFAARFPNHFADFHSIKSLVDFTCAVCNDKFANLDNLILHVTNSCLLSQVIIAEQLSNTGTNQIETCINDERTPSDEESVISEASSKASGGRCQFCGIPRVKPNHILIHINSEERPYRCSGCKGGFLRPYSLQVHERSCVALKNTKAIGLSTGKVVDSTVMFEKPNIGSVESKIEAVGKLGDIPNDIELPLNKPTGKLSNSCSICGEHHNNVVELVNHMLVKHTRARHLCENCFKPFMYKEALHEHQLHCGQPKKEEVIPSESVSASDKVKTDEIEQWKCLSCGVKYDQELQFLLHVASHEVSHANRCNMCSLSFQSAADVCMHMVKYHKLFLTTGLREGADSEEDSDDDDTAVSLEKSKADEKSNINTTTRKASFPNVNDVSGTKCLVCNRQFKTLAILKRHYGIHDGSYPSICLICGIGFGKLKDFKKHKANVHMPSKSPAPFTCPKCDGVFDKKYLLAHHIDLCICSKYGAVMQCLFCTKTFDTWNKLKSHEWSHINRCSFCNEKITVYSKRVEHVTYCPKNPNNKGSQLSSRGVSLPSKENARKSTNPSNAASSTNKKKFKCKECCATYTSMQSLKRHELLHEQAEYRCRICGGKFVSLLAKNRHILQHHRSADTKIRAAVKKETVKDVFEEPAMMKTYFTCDKCDKCFPSKEEKDTHDRTVHTTPVKVFNCKLCDKRFPSKFARRRHMQKSHSGADAQAPSLSCHICGKRFPSNFAKLQHLKKIHQLVETAPPVLKKERRCKICGAVFEHKAELKAHRRTEHAQEVKANSIDLMPHMLVLGDAKPEIKLKTCKLCGDQFHGKAELKAHVQSVHHDPVLLAQGIDPATIDRIQPNTFSDTGAASHRHNSDMRDGDVSDSRRHKVRECKECNLIFVSKSELKAHRKSEHKEGKLEYPVYTLEEETPQVLETKPPVSRVGDVVLPDVQSIRAQNVVRVLGAPPPPPPVASLPAVLSTPSPAVPTTDNALPFKCEHCSKTFKLRISLNQHHMKAHPWIP